MSPARTKKGMITVNRIKAARISLGWGMRELAHEAGVSLASVQRAETSKEIMPSAGMKIAKALDYSVEDLWELAETKERS